MQLENIVVGVDFSPGSALALEHAARLAPRLRAKAICVVHASCRPACAAATASEQVAWDVVEARYAHRVRGGLDEMIGGCSVKGVKVSQRIVNGLPAPCLADCARDVGAGLVVIGSSLERGARRFALGSVTEALAWHASLNVLVARRDCGSNDGYRRVLVPVDFSEQSVRLYELACSLVAPGGAVDLIHCWRITTGEYAIATGKLEQLGVDRANGVRTRGAALMARMAPKGYTVSFVETESLPASGIRQRLDSHDYDCVVIGSRSGPSARFGLGGVAESIVRYARCSVVLSS